MPADPAVTSPPAAPSPAPGAKPCRATMLTVQLAAIFCLCVLGVFVAHHWRSKAEDPLKSVPLAALKERLLNSPKDEPLKEQIRALDLQLRQRYFRHVALNASGAWLLLSGLAVALWAGRKAPPCTARTHLPRLVNDAAERQIRLGVLARWTVAGVAGAVGVAALALGLTGSTALPDRPADVPKFLAKLAGQSEEEVGTAPTTAEFAMNWPRFLGPEGNAFTTNSTLPASWERAGATSIVWQASLTNAGFNSPIVWSNCVFVSGGDASLREVFCFDANTGARRWQRAIANVPGSPAQPPNISEGTGFAASTLATDGRRVYVLFANGDLAALKFDGSPAWSKNLGVPKNQYGHASSLVPWQGRLLVQLDQGEAEQARSRLYAFDGPTGRTLWERTRQIPESWATPCVAESGGKPQIITLGGQWVIAYSAQDGSELWRADVLVGEITPSPIFVSGLVLAVSPTDKLVALRPDGQGDVTKSHLAWTTEDNIPDISSPVSNGELVFLVNTPGMVSCFEVKDGKKQWEHDLGLEVNATPAVAGDRLVVLGKKGAVLILAAAREFKQLAAFDLGEPVLASPALGHDRLFVRSTKTLFCLGDPSARPAPPEVKRP